MERDASHVPGAENGSYPIRGGNQVHPLVDGEPAFRRICEAVESAHRRVWVTIAFVQRGVQMPDGRGTPFDVLDRARARGLDVRVIFWRSPEQEREMAGVHFSGTEEERDWLRERGSRFLARWDRIPGQLCHHQKSWLIDAGEPGEVAFVGGINLNPASVVPPGHPPRPDGNTHDVYVEIRGPAATDVHHNFVQRWNEASERRRDDGAWPDPTIEDLPFPERLSPASGVVPVQITRTVRRGCYTNGVAPPGGRPFPIDGGERSCLEQYLSAIDAARRSIYVEDQVIAAPGVIERLDAALGRGVEVVFLVPVKAHPAFAAARHDPSVSPLFEKLHALGRHDRFTLAAISSPDVPGPYHDIYVHAKIMLVDDGWATIGSTNVADRSFYGDTELNASFWHEATVRALRVRLLEEHLGVDTTELDDRAALGVYREAARKNGERRARGEPLEGLAFSIDPERYGL